MSPEARNENEPEREVILSKKKKKEREERRACWARRHIVITINEPDDVTDGRRHGNESAGTRRCVRRVNERKGREKERPSEIRDLWMGIRPPQTKA